MPSVLTELNYGSEWNPADLGFLGWNFDPVICGTTGYTLGANGTIYVAKCVTAQAMVITNLHVAVTTAGGTLTSGQNFMALYNSSKNLLRSTADQTTAWGSTGVKTAALSGGTSTVAAGYYYVAMFANGTTRPTMARATSLNAANGLLSNANSRWASADTGRTTSMPSALGTFTGISNAIWVTVS